MSNISNKNGKIKAQVKKKKVNKLLASKNNIFLFYTGRS